MPLVVPIIVQIKPVDVGAEETRLADRHVVYQVVSQRQPIDLCQRLSLIKQVEAARPLSMWCSWRTRHVWRHINCAQLSAYATKTPKKGLFIDLSHSCEKPRQVYET